MSRPATGAWSTGEAYRINIGTLIQYGVLARGVKGTIPEFGWQRRGQNSGKITIHTDCTKPPGFIRLVYGRTSNDTGITEKHDHTIELTTVSSNLGKGNVPYFVCPETGKRCRVLYMAYGSPIWKSRAAYNGRLYYPSQLSSSLDYNNDRYWALDRQIADLRAKGHKRTYQGRVTRPAIRLMRLELKQQRFDELRWTKLPKRIAALMGRGEFEL